MRVNHDNVTQFSWREAWRLAEQSWQQEEEWDIAGYVYACVTGITSKSQSSVPRLP